MNSVTSATRATHELRVRFKPMRVTQPPEPRLGTADRNRWQATFRGGVVNFGLVLLLAWAPPPLSPAQLVRRASPLIAVFYLAAIFERALNYWPSSSKSTRLQH